jgi:hypothetical protein
MDGITTYRPKGSHAFARGRYEIRSRPRASACKHALPQNAQRSQPTTIRMIPTIASQNQTAFAERSTVSLSMTNLLPYLPYLPYSTHSTHSTYSTF